MMSRALAEIWPEDDATWTEASWMLSTTLRRFATISFRLRPSVPTSSSPSASIFTSRSPFATCSEASGHRLERPSQRPASAQPTAEPTAHQHERRAAAPRQSRRRCTARSARWLIATSTPPFTDSAAAGAAPSSSPSAVPPPEVVTGARNSSTGSPSVGETVASPRAPTPASWAGRGSPCRSGRATSPLASRIMAPTTSEASPVPPGAHGALEELREQRLVLGQDTVLGVEGEVARDVAAALDDLVADHRLAGDQVVERRRRRPPPGRCPASSPSIFVRIDLVLMAILVTPARPRPLPRTTRAPVGAVLAARSSLASSRSRSTRMMRRSSSLATPRM